MGHIMGFTESSEAGSISKVLGQEKRPVLQMSSHHEGSIPHVSHAHGRLEAFI